MILLHQKGERKILHVKREIGRIIHSQHIDFLCNLFNAPFQFTHSLFLFRIFLNERHQNLIGNLHFIHEIDLPKRRGKQIMFRNGRLLFQIIALEFNDGHAIQKDAVNLGQIVCTKDEHHLAQINGDT